MKYKIRWRWEGDITIDAKDEEEAKDHACDTFANTDLFNTSVGDYDTEDIELLSCEEVG